jgi:uncharacterized repeat protein (TIGR01451 family)
VDAGSVVNTATAAAGAVVSPPDSVTVPMAQVADLSVLKTAVPDLSDPPKAGDTIAYEIKATNDGNVTLTGVTVTDSLLATLSCDQAQPATLAPGAAITCTATYVLTQADIDAGAILNTARGSGTGPGGVVTETDVATVPIGQVSDLTVGKSAVPHLSSPAKVGDRIDYTVTDLLTDAAGCRVAAWWGDHLHGFVCVDAG